MGGCRGRGHVSCRLASRLKRTFEADAPRCACARDSCGPARPLRCGRPAPSTDPSAQRAPAHVMLGLAWRLRLRVEPTVGTQPS